MEDRTRRIIETALELAEEGGFEAVRMRDVAAQAGVALGTFYKRFRSKEDLLVAALQVEMEDLQQRMAERPWPGPTPYDRVCAFFETLTKGLCRKPNLAKAVIRAVSSGEPELAEKVTRFHDGMTALVVAALEGYGAPDEGNGSEKSRARRQAVADILQQVWFAALVGWTGGLHTKTAIIEQVQTAAELLLQPKEA